MDGNLAGTGEQSPQKGALFLLLQADAQAKKRLDQAQEASRSKAMDTDAEVNRLLEEAHTEANRAMESLVEQVRAQAQLDAQHIADEATAAADEMTKRAHQHVDEAVSLVVAWVSGEGP